MFQVKTVFVPTGVSITSEIVAPLVATLPLEVNSIKLLICFMNSLTLDSLPYLFYASYFDFLCKPIQRCDWILYLFYRSREKLRNFSKWFSCCFKVYKIYLPSYQNRNIVINFIRSYIYIVPFSFTLCIYLFAYHLC